MKKYKNCKGQNRASDYPGCNNPVKAETRKFGLCRDCIKLWVKETDKGYNWFSSTILPRTKKEIQKKQRAEDKKTKIELSDWKGKLQVKVQEIARLIDIGLPCLALGYHPNMIHGGHIYSKGGNANIRFNLHNIHRQSAQSNHSHNDDGLLRENLAKEYGNEYAEFVSALRKTPVPKYSNQEYHYFYRQASEIAKAIKKGGRRFNNQERIEIRNTANQELGIYQEQFCTFSTFLKR